MLSPCFCHSPSVTDRCVLANKSEADLFRLGECPLDPGGYFIVRVSESKPLSTVYIIVCRLSVVYCKSWVVRLAMLVVYNS